MEEEKEEKKGGWADFESRKRGPGGEKRLSTPLKPEIAPFSGKSKCTCACQ